MLLKRLSLGLFIIPSVTIILCLITTIYLNILDLCNPFINGCYSISRVGRSYPAVLLFKPMMIITIILMIAYFFEHYRIFKKFLLNKIFLNLILLSGLVSSFSLLVYVIFFRRWRIGDMEIYAKWRNFYLYYFSNHFSIFNNFDLP